MDRVFLGLEAEAKSRRGNDGLEVDFGMCRAIILKNP
jgi:hypothetical protein